MSDSAKSSNHSEGTQIQLVEQRHCKSNFSIIELFPGKNEELNPVGRGCLKSNITFAEQTKRLTSSDEEMIFLVETGVLIVKYEGYFLSSSELLTCLLVRMSHYSVYCLLARMSYRVKISDRTGLAAFFDETQSSQTFNVQFNAESGPFVNCENRKVTKWLHLHSEEETRSASEGSWWPRLHLNNDFSAQVPAKTPAYLNWFSIPLSLMKYRPKCHDWIEYRMMYKLLKVPLVSAVGHERMTFVDCFENAAEMQARQWDSAPKNLDEEMVYFAFVKSRRVQVKKQPDFIVSPIDASNGAKKWKIRSTEIQSCPDVMSVFDNGDISHLMSFHRPLKKVKENPN